MKLISLVTIFVIIQSVSYAQIDKAYHFGAGCMISWTLGQKKPIYGVYIGHLAGISKELIDLKRHGKADYKDALSTTMGSFLPFIVWLKPKRIHA